MGYSKEDIKSIEISSQTGRDINSFLRVWQMPDCTGSEVAILEEVMKRASVSLVEETGISDIVFAIYWINSSAV